MTDDGHFDLYREYALKPLPVTKKTKAVVETEKKKASTNLSLELPREGSGRVRKVSTFMKEYEETLVTTKAVKTPVAAAVKAETYISATPSSTSGRSQRIPTSIQKCADLLKEIQKLPLAAYFAEPVDFIKLNIPDYLTIVTKPMDFRTVSENIQAGKYDSPDQFAEHMRLVFRNAITYNQMRDHPVHVAARELNSKFEEKFRHLITNLASSVIAADSVFFPEAKLAIEFIECKERQEYPTS